VIPEHPKVARTTYGAGIDRRNPIGRIAFCRLYRTINQDIDLGRLEPRDFRIRVYPSMAYVRWHESIQGQMSSSGRTAYSASLTPASSKTLAHFSVSLASSFA
jgi:hypothetical protein